MGTDTLEGYQKVADRRWPAIRRLFNYPLLDGVRVTRGADPDPSPVRWQDDVVVLSADHLDALDPGADDLPALVDALLKHEVGHYAFFPRELAAHLRYLQRAEEAFGEGTGYRLYALYADVVTELHLLRSRIGGEELLEHRLRATAAETAADLPEPARRARERVGRLAVALYQATFDDLPTLVTLESGEAHLLDRLQALEYFAEDRATHEENVVRFGHAIQAALADLPDRALLGLGAPEDRGKTAGERAFAGDDPARIPEAHLDRALSDAAGDGMWVYDRLRAFLDRRADFEDPREGAREGAAGLERGAIDPHDDLVGFYRRWAAEFPLYLTRTRRETDETAHYRSGRRSFEAGDAIHRINPFASFGLYGVPGVSTVDRFDEGVVIDTDTGIPDLLIGLDSSGSMPEPGEESHAILAAFVLARTYHRNGARVGGYNFSGGVAFLPPSRDLDALYSLLCARWGGGTVLDRQALVTFADHMGEFEGVRLSDAGDHEALLARELGEATAEAEGGDPKAGAGAETESAPVGVGAFPSLDHVLVTDGDLANESAVVAFLERLGDHARTFVLLTDDAHLSRWRDREIPNTWVYAATDERDLTDLVLGVASERTTAADR